MNELLEKIDPQSWKSQLPEFEEKTREFYDGKLKQKDYKSFSGLYGSYAQKGGKQSMLRLRMTAGQLTPEKLQFVVDMADKHDVDLIHFTTCQAVQFHNLEKEAVFDIMEKALDAGIVTLGGGGDYPRNVMCSPLSGVEKGEYFDVAPYARAAADFLLHFVNAEKMPRKLKVAFSNSRENEPHATFRDLGFAANENGSFDVYAAGGLGSNPRFGVKVAEDVAKEDILYYIMAMRNLFLKNGNYQNRAKARTRYMVEALGGEENFRKAFQEELAAVQDMDLKLRDVEVDEITKTSDGSEIEESFCVKAQKQPGLYTVVYHPIGGSPSRDVLRSLNDAIQKMEQVSMRIGPDETSYIINLTGDEARQILDIIEEDNAKSDFESSVSCIGASICQVGIRDSQALLKTLIQTVREAGVKENALPKIHISGCPSSCGTHQIGELGFRGFVKVVDKKPQPAFMLFAAGNDRQGEETMGKELGAILTDQIPDFILKLARTVEDSGMGYEEWIQANPDGVAAIAAQYI